METAVLPYLLSVAILAILNSIAVNSRHATLKASLAPKLDEWIGLRVQPGQYKRQAPTLPPANQQGSIPELEEGRPW